MYMNKTKALLIANANGTLDTLSRKITEVKQRLAKIKLGG